MATMPPNERDALTGLTDRERIANMEMRLGFLLAKLVQAGTFTSKDVAELLGDRRGNSAGEERRMIRFFVQGLPRSMQIQGVAGFKKAGKVHMVPKRQTRVDGADRDAGRREWIRCYEAGHQADRGAPEGGVPAAAARDVSQGVRAAPVQG
jgi:hypothetical protein